MNSQVESSKKRRKLRQLLLGVAIVLMLYIGSYAILSMTGGWIVSESGEVRIVLAASDIFLWQPRYGSGQWFRNVGGNYGFRGDGLGIFYFPLILLDQRYVHRTIRFMSTNGISVEPLPAPPISEYHPLWKNRFHGRFPYEARKNRNR